MKNIEIIKDNFFDRCTGCGACKNVCPVDAISMVESDEGFLFPQINEEKCINCRKCENTCPVSNLNKTNKNCSKMYAVRGNDKIRAVSSSGGIFSIIADYILSKGGYVCGSAFDENMKLKHRIISKKEDLSPLRGSKYLQSDIGTTYKEIKALLNENKMVLFVGTPCQVAGLNNFLGKDYDKLYTIDILCHGVPSQKAFDSYLAGINAGKKIKNVEFRNKRFGWSCEHILISFADGSEYTSTRHSGDPYLKAFFENIDLRQSCENCIFSESPRHGDISAGDFWGIEKVDASQNDKKGTSILLVNNKKGEALLDIISSNSTIAEYKYDASLPNRIHKNIPHSRFRRKFFNLFKNLPFKDALDKSINGKYDVGLVCNYGACNFGGSLTQYALYNVLEDMGYSTLMIERPKNAPEKIHHDLKTLIYRKWPFVSCAPQYETKSEMRKLNEICDSFVVGSDVLFRHSLYNLMGKISTLDWVDNTNRKIAYAASYGYDYIVGDPKDTAEMSYFMKQFDAFGTREKSGVKLFSENFGVNPTWVLDPVFLCDKKHYDKLIENSLVKKEKGYICSYLLDPTEDKKEMLSYVSSKLKKPVKVFSEFERGNRPSRFVHVLGEFDYVNYTVEERLQCIKNCDFMIADSFHGICFCIIYNKPFICIVNKARGSTRFESILGLLGLEDRMVESFDDVKTKPYLLKAPDYDKVNSILASEKDRCMKWLNDALTMPKNTNYSTYDLIVKALQDENQRLNNKLDVLMRVLGVSYISETNIFNYLNSLKSNLDKVTVVVSAKDTPGMSINHDLQSKFEAFGIKTDLTDKHWCGYCAIIHKGISLIEKCEYNQAVSCEHNFESFDVSVSSAPLNVGNVSSIKINNIEYSVNSRGLNFVVIDNASGNVIDSVCFDTHNHLLSAKR